MVNNKTEIRLNEGTKPLKGNKYNFKIDLKKTDYCKYENKPVITEELLALTDAMNRALAKQPLRRLKMVKTIKITITKDITRWHKEQKRRVK